MLGDLEVRSFGGGADFVAQQKMLPCATNDAALRNKGVGGYARRLAGCGKLQGKKCALFGYEIKHKTQFLHICPPLKSQRLYLYAYADFDIILRIN